MKISKLTTAVFLSLVITPVICFGAEYCILEGGSGDGSNWNNAYGQLPDVLERGAEYYIADGSYGSYTFDDPVDGDKYIYIKKAIESDHGADIGWDTSYGDGIAHFSDISANILEFKTGYYIFDGKKRDQETNGHGFKISKDASVNNSGRIIILHKGYLLGAPSHIEIKYCDIGPINAQSYSHMEGIRVYQDWHLVDDNPSHTDLKIQYCFIHDLFIAVRTDMADNVLAEYNFFDHSLHHSSGPNQQTGWYDLSSDNITIRYNKFRDICGSAIIEPKKHIPENLIEQVDTDGIWGNTNNEEWNEN